MCKILKFTKPDIEDIFMQSLNEQQQDAFAEILAKIKDDYDDLLMKYAKLSVEYQILKMENDTLKGK